MAEAIGAAGYQRDDSNDKVLGPFNGAYQSPYHPAGSCFSVSMISGSAVITSTFNLRIIRQISTHRHRQRP
jgi:hypothetical protein